MFFSRRFGPMVNCQRIVNSTGKKQQLYCFSHFLINICGLISRSRARSPRRSVAVHKQGVLKPGYVAIPWEPSLRTIWPQPTQFSIIIGPQETRPPLPFCCCRCNRIGSRAAVRINMHRSVAMCSSVHVWSDRRAGAVGGGFEFQSIHGHFSTMNHTLLGSS
jgi:hypothetical protein